MSKAIDSNKLAALEEVAPYNASSRSDTPTIIVGYGPAGNDATCEEPGVSGDDAELWAQRALAANGFGDAGGASAAPAQRRTSYELHQAARAHRSSMLGDIIVAAVRAAGAAARRAFARYQQRRQARAIYDALRQLDDRMLRDLGFDRSEIRSVAAELSGAAESTRLPAQRMSRILPGAARA